MSKTIEQLEQELDKKIPREVVQERSGGAGMTLAYLPGYYVIDRLNKVFGPMNWTKEITDIKEVVNKTGKGEFPAYLVKVRLNVFHEGRAVVKEGYGYGCDKSTQNAHELAIKEAVTDGLKVAAKDLGMSMGLALYSKDQENVDDGPEKDIPKPKASHTPSPVKTTGGSTGPIGASATPLVTFKVKTEPVGGEDKTSQSTADLEETIRGYVRVAEKQKRLAPADFKANLTKDYGVGKLSELTLAQLNFVLTSLQTLTK